MITNSLRRTRDIWVWPLFLVLLLVLLQAFGDAGREWLRFDRAAIAGGQWWRLASGSFVHLGWYHLLLNSLGLLVLVLLCPQRLPAWVWLRRLLLLSTGMGLFLYALVPWLQHYVGMSGVIHGLFLLGLVPQLRQRDLIAAACLLYLLGKLAYEIIAGAPVSDEAALGGHVITESHLYGTITALLYGLMFGSFTGREKGTAPETSITQTENKQT
ncbi:rhomboid family GlyGly-CTERM serine protease [Solimonas aquatica]|uniref:Rhomboid family GlyGly-CTERM serine protease n=1 Tax=Solimonas aquatica TaxID=489703 RepID=A0A1H9HTV0_9GAMM|nr:rhomboid family GlyGly-CTERM serine protease [Solimonas aquatica]